MIDSYNLDILNQRRYPRKDLSTFIILWSNLSIHISFMSTLDQGANVSHVDKLACGPNHVS